jgi:hypothetical protein
MITHEIPRDQWREFLDGFSRQHDHWLASLEVIVGDAGKQTEARELPLRGITMDEEVFIQLGDRDEHVTHTIQNPMRIRVERTDAGADAALRIESRDEPTTVIRFRTTAESQLVDGVMKP